MFKSYQAIIKSKRQIGEKVENPFYGSEILDEKYFLDQTKDMVRQLLLGDRSGDPTIKCYGFKEIRYITIIDELHEYIEFLKLIFPNPCFIFNTRNNEDVINSWINVNWADEETRDRSHEKLSKAESLFAKAILAHRDYSFHITYEDVVSNSERLKSLYTFLGASHQNSKIEATLALRHSYKPKHDPIQNKYREKSHLKISYYRKHRNILIERHKLIFFIIPKNGCSTIKAQIADELGMEKGTDYPNDIHDHEIYNFFSAPKEKLNEQFADHLRFCIARNPWDRLVSCYKDKIRSVDYVGEGFINGVSKPLRENDKRFYGGMPFDEFVEVVCSISDARGEHHFTSQLFEITDSFGNLLVNYIGNLETIQNDYNIIARKTGLKNNMLPHHRRTIRKSYKEYYSDYLVEKVQKRFAADIEFFGYDFEQKISLKKIGFITEEQADQWATSTQRAEIIREKNLLLRNKLSIQTNQINRLGRAVENRERKLNEVLHSLSWRYTAPIRKIISRLKNEN